MKVRKGFVSNSSTSSFLIYGLEVTPEMRKIAESDSDIDLYDLAEEAGFAYHTGTDYGNIIGKNFTDIGEDETPRQFKIRVALELEKFFGTPIGKCYLMNGQYPC